MSSVTSAAREPQTPPPPQPPSAPVLVARAKALGWTQNELARRAKKNSGFVSRLLNKKVSAPGVYRTLVKTVEREERRRTKRATAIAASAHMQDGPRKRVNASAALTIPTR